MSDKRSVVFAVRQHENSHEIIVRPRRQITLPKGLCERLGIKEGERLIVVLDGDRLIVTPARTASLDALQEIRRIFRRKKEGHEVR